MDILNYIKITNDTLSPISNSKVGYSSDGDRTSTIDDDYYAELVTRFNRNRPQKVILTNTTDNVNDAANETTITEESLKTIDSGGIETFFNLAEKNQQLLNILSCIKNMAQYFSDNLYNLDNRNYANQVKRAARCHSISYSGYTFDMIAPFIYAEGIDTDLKIFIIVRGIPLELKRTDLSVNNSGKYDAIFRYPEYAYNFQDCEDSWEKMIANKTISGSFYKGSASDITKAQSDPVGNHNLNLVIKTQEQVGE